MTYRWRWRVSIGPRAGGILGCLSVGFFAVLAVALIGRGGGPSHGWWPAAVLGGAGGSAGLITLTAASLFLSRGRRVLVKAGEGLVISLGLVAAAGLVVIRAGGSSVSPWQVGLAAAFLPVACLTVVIIAWLTWPAGQHDPRLHLTVTITAREGIWLVTWSGLGRMPCALRAGTLTAAADMAAAAAAHARPSQPFILQTVIYTGRRRGPWFDITGEAGGLTAVSSSDPGQARHARTLDDLITATEPALTGQPESLRLRWTRQITPAAAPALKPEQPVPGQRCSGEGPR